MNLFDHIAEVVQDTVAHCNVADKAQTAAGVRLKDSLEPVSNKCGQAWGWEGGRDWENLAMQRCEQKRQTQPLHSRETVAGDLPSLHWRSGLTESRPYVDDDLRFKA